MALYEDNGGCELPCWWGIRPGETTLSEALARLAPLGKLFETELYNEIRLYGFHFVVPEMIEPTGDFSPDLYVNHQDIVAAISLNTRWIQREFDYSLAGILKTLGQPDEIWLQIDTDTQDGRPYLYYDLFYPAKGIVVGTHQNATYENNAARICPQDIFSGSIFPPTIFLWSPEQGLRFFDLTGYLIDWNITDYLLLEDLTDEIDTRSFYETYLDPKTTDCFHVPLDKIPGYTTPIP